MPEARLFVATHAAALERADALEAGGPATGLQVQLDSPYALESLGQAAAEVVRFGSGDLEPAEVDLDHENLYRLPEFWCEVMAEVARSEDTEAAADVAAAWAAQEDVDDTGNLAAVVASLADLAVEAEDGGVDVYVWMP